MDILVIASESQKHELISNGTNENVALNWTEDLHLVTQKNYDVIIDLLFENDPDRIDILQRQQSLVIINSVMDTLSQTSHSFVRINGWDGFLSAPLVEASCTDDSLKEKAERSLGYFNKKIEWLPDQAGFITPRVISMIINEAFLAMEEGVSSEEEINTAMKLGTNYPYGPFEWAEKIGVHKVSALLTRLSAVHPHYAPCRLLLQTEESC
jgi:3-hydroxybutyryl-CoA dehydrogenase